MTAEAIHDKVSEWISDTDTKWEQHKTNHYGKIELHRDIDRVLDTVNSRTCEHCKYYKSEVCTNDTLRDSIYPNMEMLDNSDLYLVDYDVAPDFGCNKWSST